MDVISVRHASGQLFRVGISGTGAVQIKDSSGTVLSSTVSGAWAIDRWNRIELKWDNSGGPAAGVADLEVFNADGDTPTGTASVSGVNLGTANTASIDVGNPNLASFSGTHYFDSVQMNDGATSFIGPYVVANELPQVTAGGNQTLGAGATASLSFSVTDTDRTIASRSPSFDFPTSGAPSISGGNTNSPSFTTGSAPQLYIVLRTAADNDGGEDSATTQARAPPPGAGPRKPVSTDATAKPPTCTTVGDADKGSAALAASRESTYLESRVIPGTAEGVTV